MNILNNAPLFYPSAIKWMWNYCIYLGPFTDSKGNNYDLGIYLEYDAEHCGAIVFGNTPGDYYSGDLHKKRTNSVRDEKYVETIKRAKALGLY